MKRKCDEFFEKMQRLGYSVTFDDVKLRTGYAEVMPNDVNIQSRFSVNMPVKIPISSAAMDTVTESKMAIEIAKLGGIGVIHKNLSPEEQAEQVRKVKSHLNGLIPHPVCFSAQDKMEYIMNEIDEKRYDFHTFPVIDSKGILIGILTNNHFELCDNPQALAKTVMTKKVIYGKKGTDIAAAFEMMKQHQIKVLPLVDRLGRISGMYTLSDVKRIVSGNFATSNTDKNNQLVVGAAVGVLDDAFSRLEKLAASNVDVIVIDTAHGDSKPVLETLRKIKHQYSMDIVAGNISEADSARRLIRAGADGIKVGQGPGSICTTGVIAGVGAPQLAAVYECSLAAGKSGIPIIADGGIKYSGDIPKAIGAGAECVMLGGMLAGAKESPGREETYKGVRYKVYRGMGSKEAMEESAGSRQRYNQTGKDNLVPEGVTGIVPYVGELKTVFVQLVGGLRKAMGYVGAKDIRELQRKANFRFLTPAGRTETHPHDVEITRDAPNYTRQ